jgi:hypothetical protein
LYSLRLHVCGPALAGGAPDLEPQEGGKKLKAEVPPWHLRMGAVLLRCHCYDADVREGGASANAEAPSCT